MKMMKRKQRSITAPLPWSSKRNHIHDRTIEANVLMEEIGMQNEISKLVEKIRANIHPTNFETETVENSRKQIKELFFSALQLSFTTNNSFNENNHVQYDSKTLFHLFFYKRERDRVHRHQMNYYSIGINWVHLCKDHDSQRRNETYLKQQEEGYRIGNRNHTTLELTVEALLDASVIPPCLTGTIVEGLFITCIEVFSSFSSSLGRIQLEPKQNIPSSLRLLQNTIHLLLQKAPIVNISKKLEMYVFTFVMGTIRSEIKRPFSSHHDSSRCIQDIIRNYNTLKRQTVLIIMNDLILMRNARDMNGNIVKIRNRIHTNTLINPLLCLIREIDDMDIFLLKAEQEDKYHDHFHIPCRNCRFKLSNHEHCNRKKQKTLSNQQLHDELSDEEAPYARLYSSKKSYDRSLEVLIKSKLEFKKIIGANGDEQNERPHVTCMYCTNQEKRTSGRITALSIKMVEFRQHLYRLYFEVLQRELHRNGAYDSVLFSIFRFAIRNHKSPSSRLCAIYAADVLGIQHGYMQYITYIGKFLNNELERILESETIRICIHIYCEVITETSVFEDASACWSALEPLLEVVLTIHEESKQIGEENFLQEIVDEALKAIGNLLAKRHFIFEKTNMDKTMSFNSFALRFSEEFERREHWIDNMMSAPMQSQIESTLQKLGILSFCQIYESKSSTKITKEIWSYDPSFSIRASNLRMGPILAQKSIFSNDSIQNQNNLTSNRQAREREDSLSGESIINVINDDITHLIFSFLGYKLLARASAVCKCWQSIANNNLFWESFFIRRFKPRFLHSFLDANVSTNIKSLFISRYCQYGNNINWREQFNRSKHTEAQLKTKITNGFRHYQCRVFGCNVVIKKKQNEEKHMQKHRRDVEKKVLVILRAEERKLQREQQRKKKMLEKQKDKEKS